jgi:hypothetical protein
MAGRGAAGKNKGNNRKRSLLERLKGSAKQGYFLNFIKYFRLVK